MDERKDSARLTVPNDISYGAVVCSCVTAMAKKLGFDDESISMIELGVDEAFANVVEHAFEPDELATFDVVCEEIPLGLKVAIKEKGMPFDPSNIPEYDPKARLEDMSGAGLGTFLMKQSMDEVIFLNHGTDGKETQLAKYLKMKNIVDYFEKKELEQFEEPAKVRETPKEALDFDIRLMEEREAIEVSKCIYKTYGYTYDKEHAYYPERLVELNENGMLVSAVAVSGGEMGGHCAVFKDHPDDAIGELGMAVTKPKFRGHGIMKKLSFFLIDMATDEGMTGLFAKAVANHPFSQKAIVRLGFKDCGILVGSVPADRQFKGMEGLTQRPSLVISFQYLNRPESHVVYAPQAHVAMIEKLYQGLGVAPEFRTPEKGARPTGPTKLNVKVMAPRSNAFIKVSSIGMDILSEVQGQLKELCMKRIDVIYLYLNLQDPLTPAVATRLEEMGFFFGGIFPGTEIGDALILQYLNNVPMDYDKIVTVSEMATELKDYIKGQDPDA